MKRVRNEKKVALSYAILAFIYECVCSHSNALLHGARGGRAVAERGWLAGAPSLITHGLKCNAPTHAHSRQHGSHAANALLITSTSAAHTHSFLEKANDATYRAAAGVRYFTFYTRT